METSANKYFSLFAPDFSVAKWKFIFIQCERTCYLCNYIDLPNLNSPKLPQPIFLPTRKLGPTISTPEELTECRAGYMPLVALAVPPTIVAPPGGGFPL